MQENSPLLRSLAKAALLLCVLSSVAQEVAWIFTVSHASCVALPSRSIRLPVSAVPSLSLPEGDDPGLITALCHFFFSPVFFCQQELII
jgi:hypothetical protein